MPMPRSSRTLFSTSVLSLPSTDWELAFARRYTIYASVSDDAEPSFPSSTAFPSVFVETSGKSDRTNIGSRGGAHADKHILHRVNLYGGTKPMRARHVRLVIEENGTQWGASLWRFEVRGFKQFMD